MNGYGVYRVDPYTRANALVYFGEYYQAVFWAAVFAVQGNTVYVDPSKSRVRFEVREPRQGLTVFNSCDIPGLEAIK